MDKFTENKFSLVNISFWAKCLFLSICIFHSQFIWGATDKPGVIWSLPDFNEKVDGVPHQQGEKLQEEITTPGKYGKSEYDLLLPEIELTKFPSKLIGNQSVDIEFVVKSGQEEIDFVQCRLNDGPWNRCQSPVVLESLADGNYTFSLEAIDRQGNIGPGQLLEWTVDTLAPICTIDLEQERWIDSSLGQINFHCEDLSAIERYECRVNDGKWRRCTNRSFHEISPRKKDQKLTFALRATDARGQVSGPISESWPVDMIRPSCDFTKQPKRISESTAERFEFQCYDGKTELRWVECSLDDGPYQRCDNHGTHRISDLMSGKHWLKIKAFDSAGNSSRVRRVDWLTDLLAPECKFVMVPDRRKKRTRQDFIFKCTDDNELVTSVMCSIDQGPMRKCDSNTTHSIDKLAPGKHQLEIQVVDIAGKKSPVKAYRVIDGGKMDEYPLWAIPTDIESKAVHLVKEDKFKLFSHYDGVNEFELKLKNKVPRKIDWGDFYAGVYFFTGQFEQNTSETETYLESNASLNKGMQMGYFVEYDYPMFRKMSLYSHFALRPVMTNVAPLPLEMEFQQDLRFAFANPWHLRFHVSGRYETFSHFSMQAGQLEVAENKVTSLGAGLARDVSLWNKKLTWTFEYFYPLSFETTVQELPGDLSGHQVNLRARYFYWKDWHLGTRLALNYYSTEGYDLIALFFNISLQYRF